MFQLFKNVECFFKVNCCSVKNCYLFILNQLEKIQKNVLVQIYKRIHFRQRLKLFHLLRERQQFGFVTLNGNLAVSGWVGLAYDR